MNTTSAVAMFSHFALALALTGNLAAQQVCVPVFFGNGSQFPWPPVVGGATVIPGVNTAGACPLGFCEFKFEVVMALTSPNGLAFQVCFTPPVACVWYPIPINPAFPPITQTLDESFTFSVQCGQVQLFTLQYMNPAPVRVADLTLNCSNGNCL